MLQGLIILIVLFCKNKFFFFFFVFFFFLFCFVFLCVFFFLCFFFHYMPLCFGRGVHLCYLVVTFLRFLHIFLSICKYKLRKTFSKFYRRHSEVTIKYNVDLKTLLQEGLSEIECLAI